MIVSVGLAAMNRMAEYNGRCSNGRTHRLLCGCFACRISTVAPRDESRGRGEEGADDRTLPRSPDEDGVIPVADGRNGRDSGRAIPGSDGLPDLDDVGVTQDAPGILAGGDLGPCLIRKTYDANQMEISCGESQLCQRYQGHRPSRRSGIVTQPERL